MHGSHVDLQVLNSGDFGSTRRTRNGADRHIDEVKVAGDCGMELDGWLRKGMGMLLSLLCFISSGCA